MTPFCPAYAGLPPDLCRFCRYTELMAYASRGKQGRGTLHGGLGGEWQRVTSPRPIPSRPLLIAATSQLALGGAALAAAALALGPLGAVRWGGFVIALASCGLVAARVLHGLGRHAPHHRFGLANAITLTRAAATALLLGVIGERRLGGPPALDGALPWLLAGVAVTALALDGVDGWAARRHGMASDFGARFDMDIDALFLLSLALLAHATGRVGPWVITIGLMHYAFVLAGRLWPPLAAPLRPLRRRQIIGVMQGAVLIAVMTPVMPAGLAPVLCLGALGLLLYSFGVDAICLATQARRSATIGNAAGANPSGRRSP
jgi:phosphatidylglycerophosphate synthase